MRKIKTITWSALIQWRNDELRAAVQWRRALGRPIKGKEQQEEFEAAFMDGWRRAVNVLMRHAGVTIDMYN